MRTVGFVRLFCSVLTLLPAAAAQQPASAAAASLWNGKDLAGWHGEKSVSPDAKAAMTSEQRAKFLADGNASVQEHWRVEGNELVNDGHGAFLTTDRDYGDALFTLEYKTVAQADSGIYLRGVPQVQIWDTTEAGGKWHLGADKGSGALWNNKVGERFPATCADRPFGEWNALRILMVGERVWVTLNDIVTVDGVRMENYWDRSKPLPRTGPLQLQTHGGEIRFRNLFVRELSSAESDHYLAARDAHAFAPIFDGKTFAGWQGDLDNYEVVAGAIRCRAGKGGNLFTKDAYGDFSVRLQFRLPSGGNNGLAMRYPGQGTPAYSGIELQVLENTADKYADLKPWQFHGSAYGLAAAQRGYLRPVGEWNFQEVTAIGTRYIVELNGFVVLDCDVAKLESNLKDHVGKDRVEGHFGLCGHNDPVEFRHLMVRGAARR
ncbi:MAG: DUF1080 domain-containing protein [Planctomycetota bacterium]